MKLTLKQATKSLESISADVLAGYTDKPHINADNFAAILRSMRQALATIVELDRIWEQQVTLLREQDAEIERLKTHHSFNQPSLDKYPNLEAVMSGCRSMRQALATIAELDRIWEQQVTLLRERDAEIERLKLHHSFNPPTLDKYPNLDAVMAGCVSGSPSEWPLIRREIKDMAAEIASLTSELAEAKRGYDRYEALRKLNPRQYDKLHQRNLKGENFDGMVDAIADQEEA